MNIVKFLRAPVIKKIRERLLLKLMQGPQAAIRGALWTKVFLEVSQNSQENACAWGLQLY